MRLTPEKSDLKMTDYNTYAILVSIFLLIHLFIVSFFAKYLLIVTQDHNFVHFYDLLKYPQWWQNDQLGSLAGVKNYFMLTISSWFPILIHTLTRIPLEWLYWLELLLKPCLFILLLYFLGQACAYKDYNFTLPMLLLAFWGFRIIDINLSGFSVMLYQNYLSGNYYILYLFGLFFLYRKRWYVLSAILFLGPLFHPALGLMGSLFFIIMAYRHNAGCINLIKLAAGAILGLGLERAIVGITLKGLETLPAGAAWEYIQSNGHLFLPFLHPRTFIYHAAFTLVVFLVSYGLSGSQKLRKDLLFSLFFILASVIAYFLFVYLKIEWGVKMAVMRSSTFMTFIALLNLGCIKPLERFSLRGKILLSLLIISMVASTYNKVYLLISLVFFLAVFLLRIDFKRSVLFFLTIPFIFWPIWHARESYLENKPLVELCDYVSSSIPAGTVFMGWGKLNDNFAFRTYTRCQLVLPNSKGRAVYFSPQGIVNDELKRYRCVMGREPDKLNSMQWEADIKKATSVPLRNDQLACFKNKFDVEYLIYPSGYSLPEGRSSTVYSNERFRLLKILDR